MVSLHPVLVFSADFVLGPSRFLTWTSGVTRVIVFVCLDHLIGMSCDPRLALVLPLSFPCLSLVVASFPGRFQLFYGFGRGGHAEHGPGVLATSVGRQAAAAVDLHHLR